MKAEPHRKQPDADEQRLAANVVDVRRFSTHDGRGIRTTIFLKGCSLACAWCQNPETIDPRRRPVFFRNRCIDCGLCLEVASGDEVTRGKDGRIRVDPRVGTADWDQLVDVCPTGAIRFDSHRRTVAELVELAVRDRPFFGTEGGVTLSGGEPLFLPHFAAALLRALKAVDINTAVETALNVREQFVLDVLPSTDHVFADCKLMDNQAHLRHVGHGNERILSNLRALLESDRRQDVTVRTPMIPGVTDSEANIAAIARFITDIYPDVNYELLNYNPLAAAKYELLPEREYIFEKQSNPGMFTRAEMENFRSIARAHGVRNAIAQ